MSRFDCEAILFDLDGVLVDSAYAVEQAARIWAERHGLEAYQVLKGVHGRRAERSLPRRSHLDPDAEARELDQIELENVANVCKVEGALPIGRSSNRQLGDCNSGSRALATARLRGTGLPVPKILVSAEDVENGKPYPNAT